MLDEEDLRAELHRLGRDYEDLQREMAQLRADSGGTRRRGVLAQAGATAEGICKFVYRREGLDRGAKPADRMMLDDLITAFSQRHVPPEMVRIHLRTVQAWRNVGAHDKGALGVVDEGTITSVSLALNHVVLWFFNDYLGSDFAELATALAERQSALTADEAPDEKLGIDEWRELLWWAGRSGAPKALDEKALLACQRRHSISDEAVGSLRAKYLRDLPGFTEVVGQALEDDELEDYEAEAIEQARTDACISRREASAVVGGQIHGRRFPPNASAPLWLAACLGETREPTEKPAAGFPTGQREPAPSQSRPIHQPSPPAQSPSRERRTWDEASYFAEMTARSDTADKADLHRRVHEAVSSIADGRNWVVSWGTGKSLGSFTLKSDDASLLSAYSGGTISLNLGAWGKLSAPTRSTLLQSWASLMGFSHDDPICDGGEQFPNVADGLLKHDPDARRLGVWLRRAVELIEGKAPADSAPAASAPSAQPAGLPPHCLEALRIVRDAEVLDYTPTQVSTDAQLAALSLDHGALWLEAEPGAGIVVWFSDSPEGVCAVVGWNAAGVEGDDRWKAARDRLESLGAELWPGWFFRRPDWKKAGAYEAYSRVGDDDAPTLGDRLTQVVGGLSAALHAAGVGTAAFPFEGGWWVTTKRIGRSDTDLGAELGRFALQAGREDWSFASAMLGTPVVPCTRRAKSTGNWMDGRAGIDLVTPWRPGAFAGILLDPTDHKVAPSRPHMGMDFVVILDAEHTQNRVPYDKLPAFGALLRRLSANRGRWDVLDHLATATKPNRWHPIHLRRPLVEVWEGTRNAEDRYAAWVKAAREGLELLLSGGEVRALRAAWQEPDAAVDDARQSEPETETDAAEPDEAEETAAVPKKRLQERPESVLLEEAEARGVKSLLVRLRAHVTARCNQVAGLKEVRKVWAFAYACKGSALGYPTGTVTVLHLKVHDHDEPGRLLLQLRETELRNGNDAGRMNTFTARWAKGEMDAGGYRNISLGTDAEVDAFWRDLMELQPFRGA